MQIVAILALCVASAMAAPNGYGAVVPDIRIISHEPTIVRSSYEKPVLLKSSYEAPAVVRSSYEAPVLKSSYEAPTIVRSSYEAPVLLKSSYEAPVIRSSYEAPVLKTESYGGYAQVKAAVPIIRYLKNDDNYGTYNFEVETGDGSIQHETGSLRTINSPESEGPVNVKEGSYSFTSPEGQLFTVHYTADENGFRATGDHLPTPPPIPAEILSSLRSSNDYGSTVVRSGYGGETFIRSSKY